MDLLIRVMWKTNKSNVDPTQDVCVAIGPVYLPGPVADRAACHCLVTGLTANSRKVHQHDSRVVKRSRYFFF